MENVTDEEVREYLLKHHTEEEVNKFLSKRSIEFMTLEDESVGEFMFTFGTGMGDDLFNLESFQYMYENLVGDHDLIVYSTREERDRALATAVELMKNENIDVFIRK